MKTRVITSIVALALLAVVLIFFDTLLFNAVIATATIIAIHEVYNAFKFSKGNLHLFFGLIPFTLAIMFSDYLPVRNWVLPLGYITVLYLAVCVVLGFEKIDFSKVAGMLVFSTIIVFCFYSLISLKSILPSDTYGYDAIYFVLLILGFAWGGDTCAYFAGSALGKHKMIPKVSPHKTWEGAVGGLIGSMLVGVLITVAYIGIFGRFLPFERVRFVYYIIIAGLGAVASVLGIMGDLFASAVKRQCGIKDYGTIFPGHGGVLDRFDSVLFIAPLVSMVVTAVYYKLLF